MLWRRGAGNSAVDGPSGSKVCWWWPSLGLSSPLTQDVHSNSFSTFLFVKPQLFSSTVSIQPMLKFLRSSFSNVAYKGYSVPFFHVSIQVRVAMHCPALQCFPCPRIACHACSNADPWACRPVAVDRERWDGLHTVSQNWLC